MALILTLALLVGSSSAHAFSDNVENFGLSKVGEGNFSWFGLSIYKATLWADDNISRDRLFGSTLMLTLEYDRKISKQRIVTTTLGEWERVSNEQTETQARWAASLLEILPSVNAGDRLSSLVIPGQETRFYLDGEEIGRIEDPEFGQAFLAIWLDENTRSSRLRKKLLSRIGVSA